MIRALIVDDERRARAYLAKLLGAHGDVEIVGEARDGATALEEVARLGPDLLLLDVQMPEMTGLEAARRLPREGAPYVIFTTAYDRFALEAFEVSAIDYLLKPIDAERLGRALARVRALVAARADGAAPADDRLSRLLDFLERSSAQPAEGALARLPAQSKEGIVLLALEDVYQIASEDRLVFAHTRDARYLVSFSIKDLEERLPASKFFRGHRSSIVNLDHVREVVPWFHGKLLLKLDNGAEVVVSEDRAPRLRAAIGL